MLIDLRAGICTLIIRASVHLCILWSKIWRFSHHCLRTGYKMTANTLIPIGRLGKYKLLKSLTFSKYICKIFSVKRFVSLEHDDKLHLEAIPLIRRIEALRIVKSPLNCLFYPAPPWFVMVAPVKDLAIGK